MLMDWEHDRQLITSLARGVVGHAAPDELPQFEVTAGAFFAASRRRVRRAARRDEPLGFGLDSLNVLISTAALSVTVEVLNHLAEHYVDKAVSKAGHKVRAMLGKRWDRKSNVPAEPLPVLNQEQLSEVHALAYRKATALQVPAEQAMLIADGIVAGLSLGDQKSAVSG